MRTIIDWRGRAGLEIAIATWLAAVGYVFVTGGLGVFVLPALVGWGTGIPESVQQAPVRLSNLFVRWDSHYYWTIAQRGYSPSGTERAYFPLYPFLVRSLSDISSLSLEWSALVISTTAFGIASVLLYAWARRDYSRTVALSATASLCFFPVSFYLVAFYSEPVFLALSVFSLYCARRGSFLASGIGIALAGASRPTAFLLGVGYVAEVLLQRPLSTLAWTRAVVGAMLAPMGALAYYAYLGQLDGVFAGLATYNGLLESEWQTRMALPWELVASAGRAIALGAGISRDWFSRAYTIHDTVFAFASLWLALWSLAYLRRSHSALLLLSVLYVFLLHGPGGYAFDSAPRRVLVIAPIHLAVALWVNRVVPKYRWGVVAASGLWLGVLTAWFGSGRWVS